MTSGKRFDVAGIGLNATDTLILVPRMPPYAGKAAFTEEMLSPGGQVATAMVACARLGMRVKYIGTVGDDERGRVQLASLREAGMDLSDVYVRRGCPNQTAYILIDRATGERTVFWRRDECLRLRPEEIQPEAILPARLLHIDGHDIDAVGKAARIARGAGIPVTVDVDTIYHGFERVLPSVDYLITSSEFPIQWTNEPDPFKALERMRAEYGMRMAAMTLGAHGALALTEDGFTYSPAYIVDCADTTGAGDVFHGAFCYSVLQNMTTREGLDLANAMAALNCTAIGARGGIAGLDQVRTLMARGERRIDKRYQSRNVDR
ncbi:MAG: carbohydrate kinase family protein [Bryobacteraceae bacterium]